VNAIVVVPTYEERANIGALIDAIVNLDEQPAVLVVDDNSPDGTGEVVTEYVERYPGRIFLHRRRGKLGLGTAYIDGFRHALALDNFDYIVQMDADFSHPPGAISSLLKRAASADVVIGSRYCPGGTTSSFGPGRLGLSRVAGWLARRVLGISLMDPTGGFKCFRRTALERVDLEGLRANGFAFQFEMNLLCQKLGLSMAEVAIDFAERRSGKSKMTLGVIWEALSLVWQLRTTSSASVKRRRLEPAGDAGLFDLVEPAAPEIVV
jgi:dolichol-phosphate mannosyltransferase